MLTDDDLPEEVRALDATALVTRTPCGAGATVWREWGDGEPLVLLHGSHGGWMHWLRNIPALAKARRVIVPDIPGFGDSDPPDDIDSPQAHAAALIAGLRRVGAGEGPVDVIAFSLGALLGSFMAVAAPELIRRMIIVDAGGLGTPVITADLRSVRGLSGPEIRAVNRHNLAAMMLHDPARIDETAIDISIHCGRRARTRVQYHVIPDKLLQIARQVPVPIDVIWGEFDLIHPGPDLNVEAVREFQPGAALKTVPSAGHWSMYEQPEAFNQAALELLAAPPRFASGQPPR